MFYISSAVVVGRTHSSTLVVANAWHHRYVNIISTICLVMTFEVFYNYVLLFTDRVDAFTSIVALVGIVGAQLGYPLMDPIGVKRIKSRMTVCIYAELT